MDLSGRAWRGGYTIHNPMNATQLNTAPALTSAPVNEAKASNTPAPKEGQGGKGNVLPHKSKAQYAADYAKDAGALVTALTGLGARVTPQVSKSGNIICYRFRASIKSLIAARNLLSGEVKKRATAAIDTAAGVADFFDGEFITITYWMKSGGGSFAARKTASAKHKLP